LTARPRYTPRDIEHAVLELERGMTVAAVCSRLGLARSTFYRWRAKFGADVDVQRVLEAENRRLRQRVRELAEDKAMLQYILRRGDPHESS
jgi:putative transposase